MERRFESELKDLKAQVLAMGGFVEQAIDKATQALQDRNPVKLSEVHPLEKKINEAHVEIDNACLEVLARQAPVAADLRLILAIIKINTDLERMGDQAVNISYNAEHYLGDSKVDAALNLPQMATCVKAMVRKSLDAFMRQDTKLAQEVLESDDEVDAYKNKVFKAMIPYMQKEPTKIEAALDLILIARNLERMGDHATNIAEDVIFACTGEDVRHGLGKGV
ncbi:MAG TPA: phosphate signaling complex protein PhoU [Bdellovibrionales bacterium]|nr:phosphate signaling complex protein PhoU [Bdellovibrionales bacterium]